MDENLEGKLIEQRAAEIAALRPIFDELIVALTQTVNELSESAFANGADYYRAYVTKTAYREALVKCCILLDCNLLYLETLGVLALTRYVFETLVWLRCLDKDPDQAIEFFVQLAEEQTRHLKNYEKKLNDEVSFFQSLDKEDTIPADLKQKIVETPRSINPEEVWRRIREHEAEIDLRARRRFSLHAREARTNGYGFQAHLIETKGIPAVQQHLSKIQQEWTTFESKVGRGEIDRITKSPKGKRVTMTWRERADLSVWAINMSSSTLTLAACFTRCRSVFTRTKRVWSHARWRRS